MPWIPELPQPDAQDAAAFWRIPIGAASPLWLAYGGIAAAGLSYWWMQQLLKPLNLDAWQAELPTSGPALIETIAAVQPEPVAPPETSVVSLSSVADDLTKLAGIGPTLASKLADMGVRSFAEIASWSENELEEVDRKLDLRGRAVRERWSDQARQFAQQ